MDFHTFVKKAATLEDFSESNPLLLLSMFKERCCEEKDYIQYFELKRILEVANAFYEMKCAYEACLWNLSPLFQSIELLSNRLEAAGISCYVYAYYFQNFLSLLQKNPLPSIGWNDPKTFDYDALPYEKTFGMKDALRMKTCPSVSAFRLDGEGLAGYIGKSPFVIVPKSVKVIKKSAFAKNPSITLIYLPDSVEEIEEGAFQNCRNLECIRLSPRIRIIPDKCFSGCGKLQCVLGGNIYSVGAEAFAKCSQLFVIDSRPFRVVKDRAFSGCSQLPLSFFSCVHSLSFVGSFAFENCPVKEIKIQITQPRKQEFPMPGGVQEKNVPFPIQLSPNAFGNCVCLEKVSIENSDGFEVLWETPFARCTNLREISFGFTPSFPLTSLFVSDPADYKAGGYSLQRVDIPSLSQGVCAGVTSLTQVYVHEQTDISERAFANCSSLKEVRFADKDIRKIGSAAFLGCVELIGLDISFLGTELPEDAFRQCGKIQDFSFLDSVVSFGKCCLAETNLTHFDFYKNRVFRHVGERAFAGSIFPKKMNLNLSGTSLMSGAFLGATDINSVVVKESNLTLANFFLLFAETKEAFEKTVRIQKLVTDFVAEEGLFSELPVRYIACRIEGMKIPARLFRDCRLLEAVHLFGKVGEFGNGCFENCSSLEFVDAEFLDQINLGDFSFRGCSNFAYGLLASTSYFGDFALYGTKLRELNLSNQVTHIGKSAFGACPIEGHVVLPYLGSGPDGTNCPFGYLFSETTIPNTDVQSLTSGETYYIPKGISGITVFASEIPDEAFAGCSSLKSVGLPNVLSLSAGCFDGCVSLEKVFLGKRFRTFDGAFISECSDSLEIRIAEGNPYFRLERENLISSDGETLFFAKSGTIPPSVKIIKRNAALHFSDSELVLRGIDTIEKEAIGLSKVKKLALIDVCSIENGAFINATSLEELAISCSRPISFDAPFVGFPTNGIKSVSLSCVNAPSVSALLGKSPLEISKLELRDMQLSPGFFEGVTLHSLYGKGLSGTSSVPNAVSLEIEDSAPLSSLFAGSIKAESVLIKTQDIKRGDLGGIRAKTIWLKVSGVIEKGALDELVVEEKLILDGVTYIEEGALSHLVFRDLEILNSPYHAENGFVWKDGELFYFRANGRTAALPFGLTHILPGSIDLSNAEVLTIQDPNTHIEKGAFQCANRLKKIIACKTVFCEKLIDLFDSVDAVEFIDFRDDAVPEKFLSGFPSLRTICLSPSVETISDFALSRNPKLEKVIHFERASIYGDCVLMGCKSLSEIEFSPSAQLIGFGCFKDCVSLMRVSFPIPPNHVLGQASCSDMIGDNKDVEIVINGGNIPARYFKDIQNHISIHFSIKEIGEEAFLNCPYVSTDLSFVEKIGDRAFKNSDLSEVALPSSLVAIGEEAFASTSVGVLSIPNGVTQLEKGAFRACKVSHLDYAAKDAFSVANLGIDPDSLLSARIKDAVLEEGAFADCHHLENVVLDGEKHSRIPDRSFENCTSLMGVKVTINVTSVGKRAFANCPSLSLETSFFEQIVEIEEEAFLASQLPDRITIPSVNNLGMRAFAKVKGLSDIKIGKGLKTIPTECFQGSPLCKIDLPKGLVSIENAAFASTRIKEIAIPSGVNNVGSTIFNGNYASVRVFTLADVSQWSEDWDKGLVRFLSLFKPKVKVIQKERRR